MLCREHAAEVEAVKIKLSLLCDILSNQIYVERLAGNNSPRKEWWSGIRSSLNHAECLPFIYAIIESLYGCTFQLNMLCLTINGQIKRRLHNVMFALWFNRIEIKLTQ